LRLLYLLLSFFFFLNISYADELKKVTLQLEWKHQFEFAGFYAAKNQGYYKDIGIDLDIKEFDHNIDIVDEVVTKNATFGVSSSSLILEKLNNKPVVLLASYFKQNALAIAVKKGIKSPKDLVGKKIMSVPWEMEHTSIGAMLKDAGITKDHYTLVEHDFKIDRFVSGEVDAMTIFTTSQPYLLEKSNIEYNILNPADFGLYSYDLELFTSEDMVKNETKLVQDFVKATNKGWRYALENKKEIVELIYDKYSKEKSIEALLFEADKTDQLFKRDIFKIGAIVPELIQLNSYMYIKLGLIKNETISTNILKDYTIQPLDIGDKKSFLNKKEKEYISKQKTIKVHNELDWAPFNYNIDGKPQGYSIDFISLVASKVGLEIEFVSGPTWDRFLKMVKDDKLDVMLNIASTPQREEYLKFTSSYMENIDSVFVRKYEKNLKSLADFKDKRLAVVKGFYEEELLEKHYPNIKLVKFQNTLDAIKSVAFGEVHGVINSFTNINYLIENYGITNLKPAFEVDDERFNLKLRFAVKKNNHLLGSILEKGLQQLTQKEILTLKRKWLSKELSIGEIKAPLLNLKEIEYLKNKKTVNMCVDPSWMPFESIKDSKHIGIAADFFELFQKDIGIPIKLIETNSWSQSLEFVQNRRCDILSLAMETPQRKKYLNFTKPYLTIPLVLATKMDVQFIADFQTIIDKPLAIPKGYAFAELLKVKYPKLKLIEVENIKDGLQKVKDGKIFGYIGTLSSVGYMFQKEFTGELKIAGKFDESWNLGVAVRDDHKTLLDIFNKIIYNISDHDKQTISNKWIAIKFEKGINYDLAWKILAISLFIISLIVYWNRRLASLNKELSIAKNKAEEATIIKSNFLANMSHEIRTPMNAIIGLIYLLKQNNQDKKQDIFIDKLEVSSTILLNLINDILDYSKIEAGKLQINNTPFNLKKLISNIKTIIDVKADEKGLYFNIEYGEDLLDILNSDSLRLTQILMNLLSNGIKFTQSGGVVLKIEKQKDNIYRFSVIDTGIGLSDEQIDKLFIKFTQADQSTTRKYGGTGLGLSISKELIELMDGKIWVESKPGVGSSFIFEIRSGDGLNGTIEDDEIEDTTPIKKVKVDKKVNKKVEKTQSSKGDIDKLFEQLKTSISKRRPILVKQSIEKLEMIDLNSDDQDMLDTISSYIKTYKFSEALEVINGRK